jgi:hypothetical protein
MIEFISGYVCGTLTILFIVGLSILIYDNAYKQGKRDNNAEVLGVEGVSLSIQNEDGTTHAPVEVLASTPIADVVTEEKVVSNLFREEDSVPLSEPSISSRAIITETLSQAVKIDTTNSTEIDTPATSNSFPPNSHSEILMVYVNSTTHSNHSSRKPIEDLIQNDVGDSIELGSYFRVCTDGDKCFDFAKHKNSYEFVSTCRDFESACSLALYPPDPFANCIVKVSVKDAKVINITYPDNHNKRHENEVSTTSIYRQSRNYKR